MHDVPDEPYKTAGPTVYELSVISCQSSVEEVIGG